ncbi:MAG: hypothetical protein LBS93_00320, partial [Synergistaceae bacterium]|nr:hypothetical protein [Synergistaceae bacterium]
MSIRARIFLIIASIAALVIVFSIGTGLFFTQNGLGSAIESDMTVVADIADKLITTEINLLKADAAMAARRLNGLRGRDLLEMMEQQIRDYDSFIALAVFDHDGVAGSAGPAPARPRLLNENYIQNALDGMSVMSSTYDDESGEFVMYVCVPMGDRALAVTLSGEFFSDLLKNFTIWKSGYIFMLDDEGVVIAHRDLDWVRERVNVIDLAGPGTQYELGAEVDRRMIRGESGSARYLFGGRELFCVYKPISGSKMNWSLGVVVPLSESPIQNVRGGMLLIGVVCLLLSLAVAAGASLVLEKPYKKISEMVTALTKQSERLLVLNEEAVSSAEAKSA